MASEWTLDTYKEFVAAQFDALSEALRLQAEEYSRRLHDLNGEAKRLRDIQAGYVPRETFEEYVKAQSNVQASLAKSLDETRERLEKATKETTARIELDVAELRKNQTLQQGRSAGLGASWGYLTSGVFLIIAVVAFVVSH